jgi:glycosyltransferase involved in cell wall biosynthesis
VIPWGVPPLPPPATDSDLVPATRFVLALGTLEPRKNHAHLVAAFGRLAERVADVDLVLAGPDGPARPEIEQARSRLRDDIAERVRVIGAVDDDVRSALLARAAVVAYPSIYEGFGFPVLEAMQCGTPVLAARAGAIPEVAGDAALLVEPTDEPAMADGLARLLDDDPLRSDLIERGHARALEYSWTRCATEMAQLYRSIAR